MSGDGSVRVGRGPRALEQWARWITQGYDGVSISNMTTAWRDGLAFCAIIHKFRPDLIEFSSLRSTDILENNALAFRVAEQQLGIPALLDAEDMLHNAIPDRLSVLTYVSQFYQLFSGAGLPNSLLPKNEQNSLQTAIQNKKELMMPVKTQIDKSPVITPRQIKTDTTPTKTDKVVGGGGRTGRVGWVRDRCGGCNEAVFLAERMVVGTPGQVRHRTCFRCARCSSQLTLASYYQTQRGDFCCETCPDEEPQPRQQNSPPRSQASESDSSAESESEDESTPSTPSLSSVASSISSSIASSQSHTSTPTHNVPGPPKPRTVFLTQTLDSAERSEPGDEASISSSLSQHSTESASHFKSVSPVLFGNLKEENKENRGMKTQDKQGKTENMENKTQIQDDLKHTQSTRLKLHSENQESKTQDDLKLAQSTKSKSQSQSIAWDDKMGPGCLAFDPDEDKLKPQDKITTIDTTPRPSSIVAQRLKLFRDLDKRKVDPDERKSDTKFMRVDRSTDDDKMEVRQSEEGKKSDDDKIVARKYGDAMEEDKRSDEEKLLGVNAKSKKENAEFTFESEKIGMIAKSKEVKGEEFTFKSEKLLGVNAKTPKSKEENAEFAFKSEELLGVNAKSKEVKGEESTFKSEIGSKDRSSLGKDDSTFKSEDGKGDGSGKDEFNSKSEMVSDRATPIDLSSALSSAIERQSVRIQRENERARERESERVESERVKRENERVERESEREKEIVKESEKSIPSKTPFRAEEEKEYNPFDEEEEEENKNVNINKPSSAYREIDRDRVSDSIDRSVTGEIDREINKSIKTNDTEKLNENLSTKKLSQEKYESTSTEKLSSPSTQKHSSENLSGPSQAQKTSSSENPSKLDSEICEITSQAQKVSEKQGDITVKIDNVEEGSDLTKIEGNVNEKGQVIPKVTEGQIIPSIQYPDDLNPFGSEEEEEEEEKKKEEEKKTEPQRKLIKANLNPFESDEEEAKNQEESKKNLNPFWSDDDEDEGSVDGGTPKKVKPPRPPPPTLQRNVRAPNRSPSPNLTPRKKTPAPAPPLPTSPPPASPNPPRASLAESSPTGSVALRKKARKAPLPPQQSPSQAHEDEVLGSKLQKDLKNHSNKLNSDQAGPPKPPRSPAITAHGGGLIKKCEGGEWQRRKGPAPPRPVPQKRAIKKLPMRLIQQELNDIDIKQTELERQGVILETAIRKRTEDSEEESSSGPSSIEVEDMIMQLFELVNEKNELFRRQTELMYMKREKRLEEEHVELEFQIRCLMLKSPADRTDDDAAMEERLIERLVKVVEQRDEIINCLELDRLREAQEDESIATHMMQYQEKHIDGVECNGTTELDTSTIPKKKKTLKLPRKKKKKEKEKKKKGGKDDADKDVDESEGAQGGSSSGKKKKKKWLF